jgi:regulator of protease activity HflC (stomatin/prohibitin superfamily)
MKATSPAARIILVLIALFIIVVIVLSLFITVIDAGEVGVIDTFGQVSDAPLRSGLNFKSPLSNIIKIPIRTSEYTMSAAQNEGALRGDDAIEARAFDGAVVFLDVTVYYHVKPDSAPAVYKNIGVDYESKIIRPEARSAIRDAASKYPVNDLYSTKRDDFTNSIKDVLKTNIDPKGIEVEDVLLRNITLSTTLSSSIEQKLTAQQEAQKLDFLLDREKKEAERKAIEAGGQRDAQRIINESLTDKYLYYLFIQNLKDLKGTIYVPTNNGLPLFKGVN